ncbi:MAG: 50S ribosome-binding GTPase, partial [Victivallaceae bacterium]|nr:50S ribosome-binding GTPase [Victivallaceae bacterium]
PEPEKPVSIAVVGRPNVGKSSLVNALLGEDRVMVSPVAGTTRDAIDIDFTLSCNGESRPAVLVDTAGLRKRAKVDTVVELFSAMRAGNAISRADLVLLVVEASVDGMTAQDRRIASMIEQAGRACVIVANKVDLCLDTAKVKELERVIRSSLPGMGYAPVVFVSARDRRNLDMLLDRMALVMDQLKLDVTTGVLNRVIADAFVSHTPPVVGAAPLKLFYATAAGRDPLRIVLFVNNPKYCPDNYLAFLKNTVRDAFDLVGMPIEIKLKARPKKVQSIRRDAPPAGRAPGRAPVSKKRSTRQNGKRK